MSQPGADHGSDAVSLESADALFDEIAAFYRSLAGMTSGKR